MTINDQMAAAEKYEELWSALMPDSEFPGGDQFLLWAGNHPEELVSRGINRVVRKYRKLRDTAEPMDTLDAVKYCSSVMTNEALGICRHQESIRRQNK